ncbi:hypothetical protein D3C81_1247660 [compost metagenome]
MGDAHQVVVDHVGQEVGRQAVGLHQHLHVHAIPRDLDIATQHIRNHADAFGRHLHAHDVRLARRDALGRLVLRQVHAQAVVARGFLVRHLLRADLVQTLGGAEAREGVTLFHQFVGVLLVDLATLALPVRAVRTTDIRALVPFDAEPTQRVEDLLFGLAGRTQLVGVLDTQNELAAVLAGEAEVEQRDVGGADVRIAGGRRRDAGANSGHEGSRENRSEQYGQQPTLMGAMLSGGPPPAPANAPPLPAGTG